MGSDGTSSCVIKELWPVIGKTIANITKESLNQRIAKENEDIFSSSGAKDTQATPRGAEQANNSARRGTNKQLTSARRGMGLLSSLAIFYCLSY